MAIGFDDFIISTVVKPLPATARAICSMNKIKWIEWEKFDTFRRKTKYLFGMVELKRSKADFFLFKVNSEKCLQQVRVRMFNKTMLKVQVELHKSVS